MNTLPVPDDCNCQAPCGPGCGTVDISSITTLISQNSTMQTKGTAALLRASTNHQDGWAAWIDGLLSVGDGQGGFYDYSASSAAADDGINVLKPNDVVTNGRWIKRL